ncbi:MAG: GNAT family N-acetyltransferase [Prolixibacteraceae bacterium]|nr:GNAT family N-acetyltransferase [Prolixibacteraceae bacterium]
MKIRKAKPDDACQIKDIYNFYIEKTIVTFEETKINEKEMAKRIKAISSEYPFLVKEDNNEIAGYAYATKWKERSAYRYSAEVTIYLHPEKTGKGLGTKLYSGFLDEIRKTNLHHLLAGISMPNPASVALHEKFGFKKVGCLEQVGFKFGKWIDVGYWELIL